MNIYGTYLYCLFKSKLQYGKDCVCFLFVAGLISFFTDIIMKKFFFFTISNVNLDLIEKSFFSFISFSQKWKGQSTIAEECPKHSLTK